MKKYSRFEYYGKKWAYAFTVDFNQIRVLLGFLGVPFSVIRTSVLDYIFRFYNDQYPDIYIDVENSNFYYTPPVLEQFEADTELALADRHDDGVAQTLQKFRDIRSENYTLPINALVLLGMISEQNWTPNLPQTIMRLKKFGLGENLHDLKLKKKHMILVEYDGRDNDDFKIVTRFTAPIPPPLTLQSIFTWPALGTNSNAAIRQTRDAVNLINPNRTIATDSDMTRYVPTFQPPPTNSDFDRNNFSLATFAPLNQIHSPPPDLVEYDSVSDIFDDFSDSDVSYALDGMSIPSSPPNSPPISPPWRFQRQSPEQPYRQPVIIPLTEPIVTPSSRFRRENEPIASGSRNIPRNQAMCRTKKRTLPVSDASDSDSHYIRSPLIPKTKRCKLQNDISRLKHCLGIKKSEHHTQAYYEELLALMSSEDEDELESEPESEDDDHHNPYIL